MVFPVAMYRCELDHKEDWHWRMDAFKLWCWRRLLSPLDCKEIKSVKPKENQPWIFIGMTGAEAPIFWPPDAKSPLIRKDAYAGKDWRQKERGQQRIRWLDGTINSMGMSLSKLWEIVKHGESWSAAVHGIAKSWTWLSDWTELNKLRALRAKSWLIGNEPDAGRDWRQKEKEAAEDKMVR